MTPRLWRYISGQLRREERSDRKRVVCFGSARVLACRFQRPAGKPPLFGETSRGRPTALQMRFFSHATGPGASLVAGAVAAELLHELIVDA